MKTPFIDISEKYGPNQRQVESVKKILNYDPEYLARLEEYLVDLRRGSSLVFESRPVGTRVIHSISIDEFSFEINFIKDI